MSGTNEALSTDAPEIPSTLGFRGREQMVAILRRIKEMSSTHLNEEGLPALEKWLTWRKSWGGNAVDLVTVFNLLNQHPANERVKAGEIVQEIRTACLSITEAKA